MVNISTRTWGLIITMTPPVGKTDLARYFDELRMTHLQESKGFFGVLFDLAQQDGAGTFLKSIIKTADPERYGIKIGDYFV